MSDAVTKEIQQAPSIPLEPHIREMMEAGLFYGRLKRFTNPKLRPFILHNRNGVEIINLYKTSEGLQQALQFIKQRAFAGETFLLVATQPHLQDVISEFVGNQGIMFVTKRWLGGTLTNFKIISKRIEHLNKLERDRESGALDKYTKKERVKIDQEIERLEEFLGGVKTMQKLPDVMIVIDPVIHATVIHEARGVKVPVVTLANVDANPDILEYPVYGNTKARSSVKWFLDKIAEAIAEGKQQAATAVKSAPDADSATIQ